MNTASYEGTMLPLEASALRLYSRVFRPNSDLMIIQASPKYPAVSSSEAVVLTFYLHQSFD